MYFAFNNILPVVWGCLGVALIAAVYLLTVYRGFTRLRFPEKGGDDDPVGDIPDDRLPGVSVIIYARDNASDLHEMLPGVLAQDYPAEKMEVVVVNDGSVDEVTDVVNHLGQEHRNLYITFVPDEAHNLSRKKLAVSLGIKAAKKEVVVLTTAESRPASDRWLRLMAAPFANKETEVALGCASIDSLKGGALRFDEIARATTWLSSALRGRPYRGTGFNLAYRRELFFEAKGFSRSLNLQNGDDDIFINQIANRDNTSVVLSPEALVKVSFQRPRAAFRDLRLRHCFTQRRLPKEARMLMGSGSLAMWLWLAATTAGVTFSLPNWFPGCLFAAIIPALWIPLTVNWLRTGRILGVSLSPALLWWHMLWRWVCTLRCDLACGASDRRNFTWHTKKIK